MAKLPIVLIHGYSDKGESFQPWKDALLARGYDATTISIGSYETLTNEITVKDLAEGLDRALRVRAGLQVDEPFDAIVHSTGMLVIRSWLTGYPTRRGRLKHLIGLAPATFGSPLAHKGRSWLGALFKGKKERGPDFLEAGDQVLSALELGSSYTWNLSHVDLLGGETFYGPTKSTPYVFIFCGTEGYRGLRGLINEPGTDGTVRWAGCALNTRKVLVDLTSDPSDLGSAKERVKIAPWTNTDIPLIPVSDLNHGTILSSPSPDLVDLVDEALAVSSAPSHTAWMEAALRRTNATRKKLDEWQQFVIRAVDERQDPIWDYNIQLVTRGARGRVRELREFDLDVHSYSGDRSFRCFHVNLSKLRSARLENLWMRVLASSGSKLVGYHGFGSEKIDANQLEVNDAGKWDAEIEITSLLDEKEFSFFNPFTTTLIELILNREPLPMVGRNNVFWFLE